MMDPVLARRSRSRFLLARTLMQSGRLVQGANRLMVALTDWLVAQAREQERIASGLWADAVAAGKRAETPR